MSVLQDLTSGPLAESLMFAGGLLGVALVVYVVARWVLVAGIRRVVAHTAMSWDDALVDAKVFVRLAHIAPAVVLYYGVDLVPGTDETVVLLVQRLSIASMVAVTASSMNAFLSAAHEIYASNPEYSHRPIKGYLQLAKITIFLIAALIIIATLLNRSPWLFVSGIGAMTAVLMLIFKDTILSLVASVQIATNDMIHIGDWIEMPQAGVDGDVIDVALHTVKVQNWDKTISTIPTHHLISESFKNWRGMTLSGGRRIKRSIFIDLNSVRFLTDAEIEEFGRWSLLRDYVAEKRGEIERFNGEAGRDASVNADIRRMTNVGTLRAYMYAYLHAHPKIHHEGYTLIVRQLSSGPTGLPIEVYCFCNDQAWDRFEAIQSDIFDHIFAIVGEFGLRLYQEPAGADLDRIATGAAFRA
jgi:miniconductance mechanosensitive channel